MTTRVFSRYGRHLSIFTLTTMALTNCAETQDGRLAQGQGAGIGALAGAGIGALVGGKQGALIGAGIGGLGGYAYGTHVATKKASYARTEDWLDACIVEAEKKRKEAVAYNRKLNSRLAALQSEVRMASAAKDRAKLASLKRQISSEKADAQRAAASLSKESSAQHSAIKQAGGQGGSRLSSLRNSTEGIDTQVSTMNRNVERYAALESQTDV